jgi:hypothetical protein
MILAASTCAAALPGDVAWFGRFIRFSDTAAN